MKTNKVMKEFSSRMNWTDLFSTFSEEEMLVIRHGEGRKLGEYTDVNDVITVTQATYDKLAKFETVNDTFKELPAKLCGSIFVAIVQGIEYLVNTEGFNYARYVAKLEVQ
jgi:hypothetical protein